MPAPPSIDLGSGIDVQDTINKLIEVERRPLKRIERDNLENELRANTWEKLRKHSKDLATVSRDLHSATSPFYMRLLSSGDPQAISGTVKNNSPTSKKKIQVHQLASRHELHSHPVSVQKKLPAGNFVIWQKSEKDDLKLQFGGGTLTDLIAFLDKNAKGRFNLDQIDAGNNEKIIKLSSHKIGAAAKLNFEDPNGVLQQAGLLEKKRTQTQINFDASRINSLGSSERLRYEIQEGGKKLELSQGSLRLDLEKVYAVKKGDNLRVHLRAIQVPQPSLDQEINGPSKVQEATLGPDISVDVGDVHLQGGQVTRSRKVPLNQDQVWRGPPRLRARLHVIYQHKSKGKDKKLSFSLYLSEGKVKKWKISLARLPKGSQIKAVQIYTDGKLALSQAYFDSPEELKPAHENKIAQDAIIEVDGVRIRRSVNTGLTNILPGASIDLKATTTGAVDVSVKADEAKVISQIKKWVGAYNTMVTYLRQNMRVANVTKIPSPVEGSRQRNRDQGGFFATDSTARQLLSQGQAVVASAYPKKTAGFPVLADIGISTGRIGARWEEIRSGLLQLEDDKLQQALTQNISGVQYLFGADTNNDLRLDNGVAYKMDQVLRPYNQAPKGLIGVRIQLLKNKIASNKEHIGKRELMLERKKEKLRFRFSRMEQAVKRNRSLGDYIKNINPQSRDGK